MNMEPLRMSYRAWRQALGPSAPLDTVPLLTGFSPEQVAQAVSMGRLAVHRFRTTQGQVLTVVKQADLDAFAAGPPPLTFKAMSHALQTMLDSPPPTAARIQPRHRSHPRARSSPT